MPPSSSFATISPPAENLNPQREHIREALLELALQDWMVIAYQTLVLVGVLLGSRDHNWTWAVSAAGTLWIALTASLLAVRARLFPGSLWRATWYRVALIGSVQVSYVLLRWMLPVISPWTLDAQLYQFDLDVFGIEPAVALSPYVTGPLTEWFSFVYYGYFILLLLYLLPVVVFAVHRRAVAEFTLGLTITFCTGQALYMVVPGYGPGVGLPQLFEHPLPIGFFGSIVADTVEDWGAQKDIFPSIHTAVPFFLCLWSFRFRRAALFRARGPLASVYHSPSIQWFGRRAWFFTALFSVNIIAATMYLRWHYLVDVVAGVLLGTTAFLLSIRLTGIELATRDARGAQSIWPQFVESETEAESSAAGDSV